MARTVKEHMESGDRIQKHVREADALVQKLKGELENARTTLEELRNFQLPDHFTKSFSYRLPHIKKDDGKNNHLCMREIIDAQVEFINALLGDRA